MFSLLKRSAAVAPNPAAIVDNDLEKTAEKTAALSVVLPAVTVVANNPAPVMYSGVKTFWRARLTMKILIIDHPEQDCLEVVSYAAKSDREGSRLYVCRSELLDKFSCEEIETLATTEQEQCLRAKQSFDWDQLLITTQEQLMIRFLLSRLSLRTTEEEDLEMYLSPSYADIVNPLTGRLDVVYATKPDGLVEYCLQHQKVATTAEIQQALKEVEDDTQFVGNSFASVYSLVTTARSALGLPKSRNNSISFLSQYCRNNISRRGIIDQQPSGGGISSILQSVRELMKTIPDRKKKKPPHLYRSPQKVTPDPLPAVSSTPHLTDLSLNRDHLPQLLDRSRVVASEETKPGTMLSRPPSSQSSTSTSTSTNTLWKRTKLKKQPSMKKSFLRQQTARPRSHQSNRSQGSKAGSEEETSLNLSVSLSRQLSKRSSQYLVVD